MDPAVFGVTSLHQDNHTPGPVLTMACPIEATEQHQRRVTPRWTLERCHPGKDQRQVKGRGPDSTCGAGIPSRSSVVWHLVSMTLDAFPVEDVCGGEADEMIRGPTMAHETDGFRSIVQ